MVTRDIAKECANRRVIRVSHALCKTACSAPRRTVRDMNDFNARVIEEFRSNGGRVVQNGPFGRTLVLLHTVGARSGAARINPLFSQRVDGGWIIAASKAGHPSDPAWAHNLRANPDKTIVEYADEAGAVHSASVRVSELAGEERSAAWERFVAAAPMFGEYQVKAGDRLIPLFTLTLAE